MRWRTLLPVLLGLVVPLPLAGLLYIAMTGQGAALSPPRDKVLIPMLSFEERSRLRTYEQDCRTDSDCEPRLRCLYDMRTGRQSCTDSLCMMDQHCGDGFACRTLRADNGKDLVRACSLVGVRKQGELCDELPRIREAGCERGLICQGFCGLPCRMDAPSSCPEGFFCNEGDNGPSCLPTCEGRSCPVGQRCLPFFAEKASVCTTVHGQDCELNPCPQGSDCTRYAYPTHPGEAWMECLRECGDESAPPCPEGTVCHLFQCRKSCAPESDSTCGPGFSCGSRPGAPWTCVPGTRSSTESSP